MTDWYSQLSFREYMTDSILGRCENPQADSLTEVTGTVATWKTEPRGPWVDRNPEAETRPCYSVQETSSGSAMPSPNSRWVSRRNCWKIYRF